MPGRLHLAQELLRVLIHHRRIVRVGRGHQHPLRVRSAASASARFHLSKEVPRISHQSKAIKTSGFFRAQQDKALGKQRIGYLARRSNSTAHARVPDWNRHLHGKRGEAKIGGPAGHARQKKQHERGEIAEHGDEAAFNVPKLAGNPEASLPNLRRTQTIHHEPNSEKTNAPW